MYKEILFKTEDYTARLLDENYYNLVQYLCEKSSDYFKQVTGIPPGPTEGQNLFIQLPKGKDYKDKLIIGLFKKEEELIGLLDIIRHYPSENEWFIGLMLIEPKERGAGTGAKVYKKFEEWTKGQGALFFRLGVMEDNKKAYNFWKRMGFEELKRMPHDMMGNKSFHVIIMRKNLNELII